MIRRPLIAAVGVLLVVAVGLSWRQWVAWNVIALPVLPPPAQERPEPCDERPARFHLDGQGPPQSWKSAAAGVDAVLVARLDVDRPEVIDLGHCLWFTAYPFTVQEVIKGELSPGDIVRVNWPGRPIDLVDGYPKPKVGEVYLIFLKAATDRRTYHLAFGPYATMKLIDGRFIPISKSRQPLAGADRSADDFLADLRKAAGGE